ncbi:MAG: sugar phosphate nucleotidyltransferase [Pseudomonadota bacterium]
MLFEFEKRGDTISIVCCIGALSHADSLLAFNKIAEKLYAQGVHAVALDCSGVRRFTSAGLAGFIDVLLQNQRLRIAAFGLPEKMQKTLIELGYDRVLPIFKTEEETLTAQDFKEVSLASTKVVLLCAGRGSRISPLSEITPKPMLDILGKPILAHILDHLEKFGVRDVLLNPGHLGDQVHDYFAANKRRHQSLTFYNEGVSTPEGWCANPAGSATTLRRLQRDHGSFTEDFIVMCGDALIDVDLSNAMESHRKSGADLSIIAKDVPLKEVSSYGVIGADHSGKVNKFQEKPSSSEALSTLANIGVYICKPHVLEYLSDAAGLDIANDLIPSILNAGLSVHVQAPPLTWLDVGCARDYFRALEGSLTGDISHLRPNGREVQPGIWAHETAYVSPNADITGHCYFGPNVKVEPLAIVRGPVFVENGSVISRHSYVRASVLLAETVVCENAVVDGQILNSAWSITHELADGNFEAPLVPLPNTDSRTRSETRKSVLERSA